MRLKKLLLQIHLWIAAFTAPAIILVAVSGGLYLLGVKGDLTTTQISVPTNVTLDFKSGNLQTDIDSLLGELKVEHDYEYLKNRGSVVQTRPTSRTYLEFTHEDGLLTLTRNEPSLQKSMIELHKGHGPKVFKTYQKLVAVGLLLVILSGLWMGLVNPVMRRKTLIGLVLGSLVFFLLALG